jgi:hypothetical protein
MEPLTVFALTSYLFIHIIMIGFVYTLFKKHRDLRITIIEFSQSVNESLSRLQQLILTNSPLAGLVQGQAQNPQGAQAQQALQAPSDPDEDDDITTLGEMLGE